MSPHAEIKKMSNMQGISGLAYEKDGLVGAVQASAAVVHEYDRILATAEKEVRGSGGRDMVRAVAASALATEVLPSFSKVFKEI